MAWEPLYFSPVPYIYGNKVKDVYKRQGVKESARNLKKLGVAIEVISQATGLSKEEIEIL